MELSSHRVQSQCKSSSHDSFKSRQFDRGPVLHFESSGGTGEDLLDIINRVSTFLPDRDITEHGNTFPADFPSDGVRDELVEKFEKRLFHLRNYGYGMTLFAVSFLFTSLFEGEHGPLNDVFSPAQLQTLTFEQVEILRKKTEQFLQQNQEIEGPVTE